MKKPRQGRKFRAHAAKDAKPVLPSAERRKRRAAAAEPMEGTSVSTAPAKPIVTPRSAFRHQIVENRKARQTLKEQRRRTYDGQDATLKLLRTTMSVVAKSQKSLKDVYLDGGPTPGTLSNWQKNKVKRPGLLTVLGALQAVGNLRIAIIDEDGNIVS